MKKVLSIAGSDCSGGAGIQADLKTFSAHGVFGMSVIVSVVAENTSRVIDIQDITPDMIANVLSQFQPLFHRSVSESSHKALRTWMLHFLFSLFVLLPRTIM